MLVFTTCAVKISTALDPLKWCIAFYNAGVRDLAYTCGCLLVARTRYREFEDPRMWAFDRIHMSKVGYTHLAARVLAELGMPHALTLPDLAPFEAARAAHRHRAGEPVGARRGGAAVPTAHQRRPRG